ncbi:MULTISPECIES: ATP-binding protein [unclassified Lysobacter]|uniref:ATP-binding protein n=1 Tax=unclassified Lysobacter TaxID=2635362 RepID=UPI0006F9CC2B|nr:MULTISPECIES: ATP-binding protein [unclassified Lysobacter]KQZ56519.1 histidine kinase [Lysobacter sp. Root559]KRC35038.1 histidine kinase [Lysobacter sp. Root76]KRD70727.1 histidine kinase [Lysobacter sp. Root96]
MNGAQDRTGLRNMQQLIQLRWIAVVGQVVTIFVVHYGIGIALPLGTMCAVLAALVAFNLGSQQWWKRRAHVSNLALLVGLLVDVISLSIQLYLSGGITNPFVFLYLLQVALGTVLLRSPANWILAAAAGVCFTALAVLPTPLHIAADPGNGLADHYVQGLLICFLLVAALLVVFITRIGRILRERDARLAELRQRAAEEEHIVRMGLLASGAAHELGTPLSTLSVILGDWQHLPSIASETELHHDVAEMLAQVARCKSIVTNILLSAGETRGESPVETTLHELLDDLADEWRAARTPAAFEYQRRCEDDPSIVSDEGLRQMVFNVLDNALEASPAWVALDADCRDGELVIQVSDAGPGFSADVLERLGTPYNSSKGRPGGGLGLFLSVNVARTLGGRLTARNQPQGGAVVTVTLPLSAIALEEHGDDE